MPLLFLTRAGVKRLIGSSEKYQRLTCRRNWKEKRGKTTTTVVSSEFDSYEEEEEKNAQSIPNFPMKTIHKVLGIIIDAPFSGAFLRRRLRAT